MARVVYNNGVYEKDFEARVSIFDRAFLMADAVYEVTSVLDGKLVEFDGHMTRLRRSMSELDIPDPPGMDSLLDIHRGLVKENSVREGGIYLQVSRGGVDRDFLWPEEGVPSSMVLFSQSKPLTDNPAAGRGIAVITIPDLRWRRRDIKTTQLLYPSWGKVMAKRAGAEDAWMVEDGEVTEGTSNNAHIVKDGQIITRDLSNDILHGITRGSVLAYARGAGLEVVERPFTVEEALSADEAFITSSSLFVMPVVMIDGVAVGDGRPGKVSGRLREIYISESRKRAV